MSHEIRVFVGPIANLRRLVGPSWAGTFHKSPWRPDGPVLLALVDDEEDADYVGWYGSIKGAGNPDGARVLDPGSQDWAREVSAGGALAYIETNYHGSAGYQFAAAWVDGADAYGPATRWAHEAVAPAVPAAAPRPSLLRRLLRWTTTAPPRTAVAAHPAPVSPINGALACLGVTPTGDSDAFAAYGLGSVRDNTGFARTWTTLPPDAPAT